MPFFKVLIFWYNKGVFRKRMRLVNYKERPSNSEENDGYWSCCWQEKAMRARSILNRRAQPTGSTRELKINCANVCKKLCTH